MALQTFFGGVQNDDRLDVDTFFGGVQTEANEAPAVGGTIAPIAAHYYRRVRGAEVRLLKQSTAKIFRIGPFVDATDGVTPETGLTISQADIQISKDGGAFAQTSDASPTTTHDSNGRYQCPLTATDTGTLGLLTVQVVESGALIVWEDFEVVPANIFDSLVSGSDKIDTGIGDSVTGAVGSVTGAVGSVLGGMNTTAGTITTLDALDTAQDSQHSTTQSAVSGLNDPTAAAISDAVHDESLEDHVTEGTSGYSQMLSVYLGPKGPGVFLDSNASNTNTVAGTDGTEKNPVSTFTAARTVADAIGVKVYYMEGNADITLAATHVDWEFIGIGSITDNIINLGSQDVSRSMFMNLAVEGTQGGSGRITCRDCALQDPGPGDTTLHIFAERCGIVDRIQVDTSNDNHFDSCYSLVAGTANPIIQATGASGTISFTHWSGGIELESLSASHNISYSGIGDIEFDSSCNVNATVDLHGIGNVIDNTAGMASLDQDALVNMPKINAEADTAISDAALATAANLAAVKAETVLIVADTNELQTDWVDGGRLDLILDAILVDTAATLIDTNELQADWTNGGRLDLLLDAVALEATVAALNDISVADILTTQMTESYAANTVAPTMAQALFAIQQAVAGSFIIASTSFTVRKLDNSTTAYVITLDSATSPTANART